MKLPPFQPKYAFYITIGCLILYELLGRIPLPFIPTEYLHPKLAAPQSYLRFPRFGFFTFSLSSAFIGFWMVELLSFLAPLYRHRISGMQGRQYLNKWSMIVSLILVLYFAYSSLDSIQASLKFGSQEAIVELTSFQFILSMMFFASGFVIFFIIAMIITQYGVGNGFCIIILYVIFKEGVLQVSDYLRTVQLEDKIPNFAGILLLFALIILMARYLRPKIVPAFNDKTYFNFELSPLLMGIFALNWFYQITGFGQAWMWGHELELLTLGEWQLPLLFVLIWFPISYATYYLVSHPQRILSNTFGRVQFDPGWEDLVRMGLKYSILVVGAIWIVMNVSPSGEYYERLIFPLFDTVSLFLAYFIILDLIAQWQFNRDVSDQKLLGTFDNVHFVTYLKGLFEKEGIRFCIQGFQYRRLFFFWEPLIKMRLLVDAKDEARARELADLETVPVI